MKPLFIFLVPICFLLSVPASAKYLFQQQDSDTSIEYVECYEKFFSTCDSVQSPAKTLLVLKNKKTISLKNFYKNVGSDYLFGSGGIFGNDGYKGLADLDRDGKKELIIYNYTGGAHCCDEFYVFKNVGANKYQYAAKTFAGDVCINDKNEFIYDFYQQFGYFFTCFACEYQDSSETAPQPVSAILLRYNKGKLEVIPGDQELKNTITDNLAKLKEKPYQKLQSESDQDDGMRKAFALNLAVYYYSFGRNLIQVKSLFDKYYKFPDSKKVWELFVETLNGVRESNDF
ncbi:MAG: hypothetical protein JST10_05785 [Bacteroidetes bacterium]|nr:hypothetical protein [Bacteroidota bacterium]MBS1632067.1 hypothetical protein [Bacteroidota bacterium]